MPGGNVTSLGPFNGGLHNSSGRGESIADNECFELTNLLVDIDDGTLVNRPAINVVTGAAPAANSFIIGTYYPPNEDSFLVISDGASVKLWSLTSGSMVYSRTITGVRAGIQFQDRFYIAPVAPNNNGGYFYMSAPGVVNWTTVAAIPRGDVMVIYQNRLFLAGGDQESGSFAFVYWSAANDGTVWDKPNDGGVAGINPGDGQRLKNICVMNNDLMCFKERSTFRFTYISGGPLSAVISRISNTVGCASYTGLAVYDNNSIFVIYAGDVWQLYNYNFNKISNNVRLRNILGPDNTYPAYFQCISIFKNRLFIRYWSDLYIYTVDNKTWSQVDTTRNFDRVVSTKVIGSNLEKAYMVGAGTRTTLYWLQNDPYTNVGTSPGETFTCTMRTKIYDFSTPWQYKALMWWGLHIAASGTVTTSCTVPNTTNVVKWKDVAPRTWADASSNKWGQRVASVFPAQGVGSTGVYGRRFIKNMGKLRFRQIYWMISVPSSPNTGSDASVRIYGLTPVMKNKETVVRQTT